MKVRLRAETADNSRAQHHAIEFSLTDKGHSPISPQNLRIVVINSDGQERSSAHGCGIMQTHNHNGSTPMVSSEEKIRLPLLKDLTRVFTPKSVSAGIGAVNAMTVISGIGISEPEPEKNRVMRDLDIRVMAWAVVWLTRDKAIFHTARTGHTFFDEKQAYTQFMVDTSPPLPHLLG